MLHLLQSLAQKYRPICWWRKTGWKS